MNLYDRSYSQVTVFVHKLGNNTHIISNVSPSYKVKNSFLNILISIVILNRKTVANFKCYGFYQFKIINE